MLDNKPQRKGKFIFASYLFMAEQSIKTRESASTWKRWSTSFVGRRRQSSTNEEFGKGMVPKLQSRTHYWNMDKNSNTVACSLEPSTNFREGVSPYFSVYTHCSTSSATFVSNWTAGRTDERIFGWYKVDLSQCLWSLPEYLAHSNFHMSLWLQILHDRDESTFCSSRRHLQKGSVRWMLC